MLHGAGLLVPTPILAQARLAAILCVLNGSQIAAFAASPAFAKGGAG